MSHYPPHDAAHDFAAKWPAPPDWDRACIEVEGVRVTARTRVHQLLIGGRLDAAAEALCPQAQATGLWEISQRDETLVRLARDRALLVTPAPVAVEAGWREPGWCATDMSDAWRVFEIAGPRVEDLVARAVTADFRAGSPSAAILFANVEAVLYRKDETIARLHVDTALAAYAWRWMEVQSRACG